MHEKSVPDRAKSDTTPMAAHVALLGMRLQRGDPAIEPHGFSGWFSLSIFSPLSLCVCGSI